ncbi:DUF1800 domain-containing protein [Novosphingobium sp.]|uniref:DUF1800 domain-containing protein n=1 Tax=Novosphingobium sp. TaxID=1874826 RepID=UPI00263533BA|nr:DUF1800 domain-containing protein [Novosphingobium sp.]
MVNGPLRSGASPATSLGAIALNRFGLGARPDDRPGADPQRSLLDQFARYDPAPAALMALPDAGQMVQAYQSEQRALQQMSPPAPPSAMAPAASDAAVTPASPLRTPEQQAARKDFTQEVRALYRQAVQARMASALTTDAPFVERLVHFWSNHFCISADNPQLTAFAGAFERDAIRPHVLGRFEDMLFAVEQHPAMLVYLNQAQSVGPNSQAAQRAAQTGKVRGLNENLAREIMELHTLGVRSGYSQADVTEFARALTGWSVDGLGARGTRPEADPVGFVFRPQTHEPGDRTILGKRYGQAGAEQAHAVMTDLAHAPATARHVATKLARHFAGDSPPPALVDRLAHSFQRSRGDLKGLYATLIASPEAWVPQPVKFKTPWEWSTSALRALGLTDLARLPIEAAQQQLGQPVWKPGSPAGWDDTAPSWAAPDALLRRVELAQRLAGIAGRSLDARILASQVLPGTLSAATAEQIAFAESSTVALALLLVSPEFLRR